MLAAVLVLTVIPNWVKIGRPVVEHCCFLITQKLLEDEDVSIIQPVKVESLTIGQAIALTAAHCSKTLIAASSLGSPVLAECTRQVLPGLVEFIAKMAPLLNDGNISDARTAAVGEVWKAFSAFFSSIPENQRTLIAVLLTSAQHFL